jgi:hypothetical protein
MHTIIETSVFERNAQKLLSKAEYEALIAMLLHDPAIGDVMQGTGGFRKLRLAREGGGKSGGFRVVTFFHCEGCPVYLMDMYGKNEKDNLTQKERNALAAIAAGLKKAHHH